MTKYGVQQELRAVEEQLKILARMAGADWAPIASNLDTVKAQLETAPGVEVEREETEAEVYARIRRETQAREAKAREAADRRQRMFDPPTVFGS